MTADGYGQRKEHQEVQQSQQEIEKICFPFPSTLGVFLEELCRPKIETDSEDQKNKQAQAFKPEGSNLATVL